MAILEFDQAGERYFEAGVKKGVLFAGKPVKGLAGVAWNGLTNVTESPEGGEANDQYADNIKYLSLRGTESLNGTIEAFTYPDEFEPCMGNKVVNGMVVGQQVKSPFSFCYITQVGNDVDGVDHSEKLHIIYNATVNPTEKAYETINDSPEAITFSWEFNTLPLVIAEEGYKPTAIITITKTEANKTKYQQVIDALYGTSGTSAKESGLLLPDDVITMMKA